MREETIRENKSRDRESRDRGIVSDVVSERGRERLRGKSYIVKVRSELDREREGVREVEGMREGEGGRGRRKD